MLETSGQVEEVEWVKFLSDFFIGQMRNCRHIEKIQRLWCDYNNEEMNS